MANEQDKNPTTGTESDISKAQSQQQPPQQARQQPDSGERQQGQFETGGQGATGEEPTGAGPDEGLQGETTTRQRTDIEGASETSGEPESGFVGSKGAKDTSGEFVEKKRDEDQGFTPEGK